MLPFFLCVYVCGMYACLKVCRWTRLCGYVCTYVHLYVEDRNWHWESSVPPCCIYMFFFHLNLELANSAGLGSQLALGILSPKPWDSRWATVPTWNSRQTTVPTWHLQGHWGFKCPLSANGFTQRLLPSLLKWSIFMLLMGIMTIHAASVWRQSRRVSLTSSTWVSLLGSCWKQDTNKF